VNAVPAPHNADAEESVVGAMLLPGSATVIDVVARIVTAADFFAPSLGLIFDACVALHTAGEPVDAITVTDRLEREGTLADVGGTTRVHELAALVPAFLNAGHYARIVRAKAVDRRHLAVLREQVARIEDGRRLDLDAVRKLLDEDEHAGTAA